MKLYVKPSITYVELNSEERLASGSLCQVKPKDSSEPSILDQLGLTTTAFFG